MSIRLQNYFLVLSQTQRRVKNKRETYRFLNQMKEMKLI